MSIYRRQSQALITAFWFAVMVAFWINFAPVQAGGQASYVIVAGQSMEPGMHLGDLVVVHKIADYQVGDVVAYKNADLDRYVIHRIVAVKNGHYRLQGDNNFWIDQYEPLNQEVLGKLWIHLPKFGVYMGKLREPHFMALFAGLIGSMVVGTLFVSKQRERHPMEENSRRTELNVRKGFASLIQNMKVGNRLEKLFKKRLKNSDSLSDNQIPAQNGKGNRNFTESLFFGLAVIALLSLLLGVISFTRPATQIVSDDFSYQHLGLYAYSAAAPAGVYDSATIQSGEPIFPKLTCTINIAFNYTLVAASTENISGSYQLTAFLSHPQSGWQRTFPLQEQTSFNGNAIDSQAELNLCEIVKLIESVEEVTASRAGTYFLSVNPRVHVTGLVSGRTLDSAFEPELTFQYDRTQFYLVSQNEGVDPLKPNQLGTLHKEKTIPNTLTLLGMGLNVPALRTLAVIGVVLSLSGLAVLWLQLEHASRNAPETFVRMKYDPLIIDVEEIDLQNTAKMIGVSTIDDLAKLAEKHNVMILHAGQNNVDKYVVHVDGNSYAYAQVRQQTDIIHNSTGIYRAEFDRGIDRGEFEVHYQPIISLTDGRITAVEALLRWQHPQRGMLSAGEFIQTAEVTGFIGKLDEWALQVACTQLKEWRDAGYDLKLAVNLSDYLLARDPAELFQSVLRKTQAEASWLQIEIPEGKMAHPNPTVLLKIQQLKEMGLHITIDDFVGEVGLSSISQMQVSSVKIDRLLVKKMGDPVEAITVQRMIAVATTLGMNVVGKGVETDEEKVFLANSGSQAQGFLLGHPVPAYEIGKILQQNVSPVSSKTRRQRVGE